MKKLIYLPATLLLLCPIARASESVAKRPITNESQLAVIITNGNSETESYSAKQTNTLTRGSDLYKATASYLETKSENATTGQTEETARKWDAGLRYERALNEKWSVFLGYLVESDKYAGYQQRHNTDVGGKYILVKKDRFDALSEAGYRYIHQNNTDSTQVHSNGARLYVEGNYKFNDSNSAKAWAEYIPNFSESDDYQSNFEVSASSALSSMFSLKLAYLSKTDHQPNPGAKKQDATTTAALVAKF